MVPRPVLLLPRVHSSGRVNMGRRSRNSGNGEFERDSVSDRDEITACRRG